MNNQRKKKLYGLVLVPPVSKMLTLLEKLPERIFRLCTEFKPTAFGYWCNALSTELSKPHESGCVWVGPLCSVDVILGLSAYSMEIDVQQQ